jgi:hypothetical protein
MNNHLSARVFCLSFSFSSCAPSFFFCVAPSLFPHSPQILDARAPDGVIRELCNSSAVHSTYVFRSGNYVMSADDRGALKTWDVGTGRVVHVHDTAAAHASSTGAAADSESIASTADHSSAKAAPISHIAVCEPRESEEEGRLLAANGWDNTLRVFDRGKSLRHFYAASAAIAPTTTATTTTTTTNAAGGGASADTPADGADAKTERGPSPSSASSASSLSSLSSSALQSRSSASSALSAFTLTPVHEVLCWSAMHAVFSFFLRCLTALCFSHRACWPFVFPHPRAARNSVARTATRPFRSRAVSSSERTTTASPAGGRRARPWQTVCRRARTPLARSISVR